MLGGGVIASAFNLMTMSKLEPGIESITNDFII
jgi:hypothetical protein